MGTYTTDVAMHDLSQKQSPARRVVMYRQGELDYACGLYCLAAAAAALGCVPQDDDQVQHIFSEKGLGISKARHIARLVLTKHGLDLDELKQIAPSIGLKLIVPDNQCLSQFEGQDELWIALIRCGFESPIGPDPAQEHNHYVLVLDVTYDQVIVADPHPWHERFYNIPKEEFEKQWRAAGEASRLRKAQWAARLSPIGSVPQEH